MFLFQQNSSTTFTCQLQNNFAFFFCPTVIPCTAIFARVLWLIFHGHDACVFVIRSFHSQHTINHFRSEEQQEAASPLTPKCDPSPSISTATSEVVATGSAVEDMSVVSKEQIVPAKSFDEFVDARPIDEGLMASVYSFMKKATVVGAVYVVGYMGWSVAWLIGPVILSVIRDQWRRDSDRKRNDAKIIAQSDEKRVILARLNDLPSWVSVVNLLLFA